MSTGGKGSGRRPTQIAADEARARWDATFGKKKQAVEPFDWSPYMFKTVECVLKPRDTYNGSPVKESVKANTGKTYVLVVMWQQGDGDPYPNEYALGGQVGSAVFSGMDIGWISSGDLVFVKEVVTEQPPEVKGNTYCHGTGCMSKCSTCQHVANWNAINANELTASEFEHTKASLTRIDESQCQMTSGSQYLLQCTENK